MFAPRGWRASVAAPPECGRRWQGSGREAGGLAIWELGELAT